VAKITLGNLSLYAKYLLERSEDKIIETVHGFATYRFLNEGKSVYIIDIYVDPDFRKEGEAAAMADDIVAIAKKQGCIELLGTVCPSAKGAAASMKVLLAYGMVPHSASNDLVVFRKEI